MAGYLRNLFQALDTDAMLWTSFRVLAVLLCLTVHETCHGLAALALGDPTAKERHRLSLNPLRHIDWLGLAMMYAAGFGWAKPVPVDPRYFKNPKWGMALTALAGPLSNFVLAFLALLLASPVLYAANAVLNSSPDSSAGMALVYATLFLDQLLAPLSIGLGVFNLLPFPPLDGSKVVAALLPDRLYLRWMRYERYGMLVLLAFALLGLRAGFISGAVSGIYRVLRFLARGPVIAG